LKADIFDPQGKLAQAQPVTAERANDDSQIIVRVGKFSIYMDLLDAQALAKAIRKAHGRVQRKERA